MLTFSSSGSIGDIIYSIPAALALAHGGKISYALQTDVFANYHPAIVHPAGVYRMDYQLAAAIIPLLGSQGIDAYITPVKPIVDYDLDEMRILPLNFQKGSLPRLFFYAFGVQYDLSQPWLWLRPVERSYRLVVNRTLRYRNPGISYRFLDEYEPVFVGLESEYKAFQREVPSAKYHATKNLLELAEVIAGADVFLANQSVAYAIAEALKKPRRILEVCPLVPNVIIGDGTGYDFVTQTSFEKIVKELY